MRPGPGSAFPAIVALVAVAALSALGPAGCGDGSAGGLQLERAQPAYGPLLGGTTIELIGAGFAADAGPVRVLVAGREAPLVAALDDARLQVVIPPGNRPGDAELVVLTDRSTARATGVFRYSAPPSIDAISPADVLYSSTSTPVTLTGSGFLDEGAGELTVTVGGQVATDVVVESDASLHFNAPAGRAFAEPEIVVSNARGRATRATGFRYIPSTRAGLLLFPKFSSSFAVFFDPVEQTLLPIPWVVPPPARLISVVRDALGRYWAFDRNLGFGRLDLGRQQLENPRQLGAVFPAQASLGGEHYVVNRSALRFGRLDPLTGDFTTIGSANIPCCGSYGLAADATKLYLVARQGGPVFLYTIDPATGVLGAPLPLTAPVGFHAEEMRYFAGKLYASCRDGTLTSIDPATGIVTTLPVVIERSGAMEIFDPAR